MDFYNNYINNIKVDPKSKDKAEVNAEVSQEWDFSHLLKVVNEELSIGCDEFKEVEVWKNSVSEYSVNYFKDEADNRRLMFKDNNKIVPRGLIYDFDSNYWITYDGTNEEAPFSEIKVRRCNNVIKWVDKDSGEILSNPCCIGEEYSSPSPKVSKDSIVKNGRLVLMVQGNDKTQKIKSNQRFIIQGVPYKVTGYNNYNRVDYVSNDVNLLFFYIYFDTEQPTDDIVNNIANRYEYNYEVKICDCIQEQVRDFKGTLSADVLFNGELTDYDVNWSCNQNAIIDELGNYTLVGEIGSIAEFTATFGNNIDTISIKITENIEHRSEIVITPMVEKIMQYQFVDIQSNLYVDGIKQTDVVTVQTIGADGCFSLETLSLNTFRITNNKQCDEKLTLIFKSETNEKLISIELGALF